MLTRFGNAIRVVSWFANAVAVAVLTLMVGILIYEITARFVFNRPTGWSDVAAAYLMPFVVFLAAGYTLVHDGHVRIDTLYDRLNTQTRRWFALINETTGLAVLIVLIWFSVDMVFRVQRSEELATAGTYTFAEYLPRIVMPIGLAVMTLVQLLVWLYAVLAILRPRQFPQGADGVLIRTDHSVTLS